MRIQLLTTLAAAALAPAALAQPTAQTGHHGTFQAYKGECGTAAGPETGFTTAGTCIPMHGKASFDINGKLPKGAFISYLGKKPHKDGSCDFSGHVAHGKVYTKEFCYPLTAIQAGDFEVNSVFIQAA